MLFHCDPLQVRGKTKTKTLKNFYLLAIPLELALKLEICKVNFFSKIDLFRFLATTKCSTNKFLSLKLATVENG